MTEETAQVDIKQSPNLVQDPLKAQFEAEAGNDLESNLARLRNEAVRMDLTRPSYVEGNHGSRLADLDDTVKEIERQTGQADKVEARAGKLYDRLKATKR